MNGETQERRLIAAELPLNLNDRRAPLWWGMVGLITVEAVLFGSLIVSYFYLRFYAPEWPIGGIAKPSLLLPSIGWRGAAPSWCARGSTPSTSAPTSPRPSGSG